MLGKWKFTDEPIAHTGKSVNNGALPCESAASSEMLPYSEANHRTLIALRCADSQRPFSMVDDRFYKMEVEMLHPGAVIPSSSTVSRDSTRLYLSVANIVASYLVVCSYISLSI